MSFERMSRLLQYTNHQVEKLMKKKKKKKNSFSLPSSPPNKAFPTVFNRVQFGHASFYVYFVSNYQTSETFILMLPGSLEGKRD